MKNDADYDFIYIVVVHMGERSSMPTWGRVILRVYKSDVDGKKKTRIWEAIGTKY